MSSAIDKMSKLEKNKDEMDAEALEREKERLERAEEEKQRMAEDARIAKVKKENMAAAKKPKKFSGGGIALRGLGRAFTKSKR